MQYSEISAAGAIESLAQFTCEPAAIEAAASYLAKRIVRPRDSLPILSYVHIAADLAGKVTLTANNLDIWASVTVPADVETPGAFCTPAGALADAMAKVKKGGAYEARFADIAADEPFNKAAQGKVTVKGGRARFTLPRLPVDDFPLAYTAAPIPAQTGDEPLSRFTVPAAQLVQDLAALAPCMSTDKTRYYLRGVAVQAREMAGRGSLVMVATDGYAMAIASRPIPAGAEAMADAIIADDAVRAIVAAAKLAPDCEAAHVSIGRHMHVELGGVVIGGKLVDGTFVDWERPWAEELAPTAQPALFPDLLPGAPVALMDKLAKPFKGAVQWETATHGSIGGAAGDDGVCFAVYHNEDAEPKRGFRYVANDAGATGEIVAADGIAYPVAFTKDAIHLSAAQLRALIGESCFETMAVTMPDGSAAHILKWLWDDGDSRFLTVRPDGRTYAGAPYVTRAEIEAVMAGETHGEGEAVNLPVPDSLSSARSESEAEGCVPAKSISGVSEAPEPVAAPADDIDTIMARMAELEARLEALPSVSEAAPAPVVTVTIDMPPIPARSDNVIAFPNAARPKRTPAHERAIRRAWAERKAARVNEAERRRVADLAREARAERDGLARQIETGVAQLDAMRKERDEARRVLDSELVRNKALWDEIVEARWQRRRAIVNARASLSRLRTFERSQRQRAQVAEDALARLKRDMADPLQPERASDIAQLVQERDQARTALAASQARCERQQASIEQLAEAMEGLAVRVARAEAAARKAA